MATYYTLEELEKHKGKYFSGGCERDGSICDIGEITRDEFYELLKEKQYLQRYLQYYLAEKVDLKNRTY